MAFHALFAVNQFWLCLKIRIVFVRYRTNNSVDHNFTVATVFPEHEYLQPHKWIPKKPGRVLSCCVGKSLGTHSLLLPRDQFSFFWIAHLVWLLCAGVLNLFEENIHSQCFLIDAEEALKSHAEKPGESSGACTDRERVSAGRMQTRIVANPLSSKIPRAGRITRKTQLTSIPRMKCFAVQRLCHMELLWDKCFENKAFVPSEAVMENFNALVSVCWFTMNQFHVWKSKQNQHLWKQGGMCRAAKHALCYLYEGGGDTDEKVCSSWWHMKVHRNQTAFWPPHEQTVPLNLNTQVSVGPSAITGLSQHAKGKTKVGKNERTQVCYKMPWTLLSTWNFTRERPCCFGQMSRVEFCCSKSYVRFPNIGHFSWLLTVCLRRFQINLKATARPSLGSS